MADEETLNLSINLSASNRLCFLILFNFSFRNSIVNFSLYSLQCFKFIPSLCGLLFSTFFLPTLIVGQSNFVSVASDFDSYATIAVDPEGCVNPITPCDPDRYSNGIAELEAKAEVVVSAIDGGGNRDK